ncbi:hypothetical protein RHMOL_Rhmol05G0242200 [Rhododendron molle]|uniref:Uncharacterized protein n=1 Tax=Rhododendron molle TaxID=49168 RepID=A0ACC0NSR2_RHOML|nr:hypothetical protein RHMOL_Rhmol05G0242200 [Rhododendron molle]
MSDHSGSQVHLAYLTLLEDLMIVRSWGGMITFIHRILATHVVGYYRNSFDMQRPDEVVWRPYSEELIASLPPNCRAGRAIWMAKVPLLNFPMVQMHMPDRVMRQFGRRQTIPAHCNSRQPPHGNDWKFWANELPSRPPC